MIIVVVDEFLTRMLWKLQSQSFYGYDDFMKYRQITYIVQRERARERTKLYLIRTNSEAKNVEKKSRPHVNLGNVGADCHL